MKPMIGIQRLWYAEPLTASVTIPSLKALLKAATTKEVKNSHEGTFGYTQDDPEYTDYKNELNGRIYFRDATSNGTKTIAFSIGQYELDTKAELQGGKVTNGVWQAPDTPETKFKTIIALTKTGNYIVFTNAAIVGKVDTQEKNLALGLTAVAIDNEKDEVADEYWVDGVAFDADQSN